MIVAMGSDHAGYRLKLDLGEFLKEEGHEIQDLGTHSEEPVDYPPFCAAAGHVNAADTDCHTRIVSITAAIVNVICASTARGQTEAGAQPRGV